jgi:hypothetical protein
MSPSLNSPLPQIPSSSCQTEKRLRAVAQINRLRHLHPPPRIRRAHRNLIQRLFVNICSVAVTNHLPQLSQLEHILKCPDSSYIASGSVESVTQHIWTYDSNTKRMIQRDVKYVPGNSSQCGG